MLTNEGRDKENSNEEASSDDIIEWANQNKIKVLRLLSRSMESRVSDIDQVTKSLTSSEYCWKLDWM